MKKSAAFRGAAIFMSLAVQSRKLWRQTRSAGFGMKITWLCIRN